MKTLLMTLMLFQSKDILIAPGIYAMPNETIGAAAYAQCMADTKKDLSADKGGFACPTVRGEAIQADIVTRWKAFFDELREGRIRSLNTLNLRLKFYGLRWVQ